MYHVEERSVSTAIRYKNCAQILVLIVNKSPIGYAFRSATESYTVQCEPDLRHYLIVSHNARVQLPLTMNKFIEK